MMIMYQNYLHIELLPISHLIPVYPDGQEQLPPSTQVPPFKQGKSLEQTLKNNE